MSYSPQHIARRCLLEGVDEIGGTLKHEEAIAAYQRGEIRRWPTFAALRATEQR